MKLNNYYEDEECANVLLLFIAEHPGIQKGGIIRALIKSISTMSFEQKQKLITMASNEAYTTEKRRISKL